jgi:hypothetical protein
MEKVVKNLNVENNNSKQKINDLDLKLNKQKQFEKEIIKDSLKNVYKNNSDYEINKTDILNNVQMFDSD